MIGKYLPVFYEDPFMAYRPFPAENTDNHFINHWHEIVVMVLFYTGLQKMSPYVSTKMVGTSYTSLKERVRLNFDIHVVSMVQCVISLGLLAPMWNHPNFQNRATDPYNSLYSYYPYGGLVGACTTGYFVWDVYVCARYYKSFGIGFLLHGLAALYVFSCTLKPFCMPWIAGFLLFEASTPFVNINWFASRLPSGVISEKVVLINGICLLVSFFSVRILWGFYAVALVAIDMYKTWNHINPFFPVMTLALNLVLDVLNVFWFYKMLMIAKKKLSGKKPKQFAKETADKID